jgi:site-specific DNA recombinase
MQTYYAYIRVSTTKQGEHGSSLPEQRDAISAFAKRHDLVISEWFEEQETAAKEGRRVFRKMLSGLERGKARGVVIHKIDRGARNLRDWVELGTLVDRGIEVRFANENLDLNSRGGRLAADIQAVVAADFIRNLREEVRKGFYGRLKQGFFPIQSPIGYLDNGKAKSKTICPTMGPLVRKTFELYATGHYSIDTLRDEVTRIGLRNKRGNILHKNSLAYVLHNPFYYGLMHIKRTNQTFVGNHEPIISKELFDRVQALLQGRTKVKTGIKRQYLFQRMIACRLCAHRLSAERHKGITYYRCHSRTCPKTSLREDVIAHRIVGEIGRMHLCDETLAALIDMFRIHISELRSEKGTMEKSVHLSLAQAKDRLERLTDAYLDRAMDRASFESRKTFLHNEIIEIEGRLRQLSDGDAEYVKREQNFLELLKNLQILAQLENPAKKRDILKHAISNLSVSGKNLDIDWDIPLQRMVSEPIPQYGPPERDTSGTLEWKCASDAHLCADGSLRERLQEVVRDVLLGKEHDNNRHITNYSDALKNDV